MPTRPASWRATCSARVGLTRPNGLAEGAASGAPTARMRLSATGWSGTRSATVSRPGRDDPRDDVALPEDDGERSGPEPRGEPGDPRIAAVLGHDVPREVRRIREVDDDRVEPRPLLQREDAGHRLGIPRVRPEAVHGLRGEGDRLAAPEGRDGFGDRGRVVAGEHARGRAAGRVAGRAAGRAAGTARRAAGRTPGRAAGHAVRGGRVVAARHATSSASSRARATTASSIAGVSRPVNVFCWLGW